MSCRFRARHWRNKDWGINDANRSQDQSHSDSVNLYGTFGIGRTASLIAIFLIVVVTVFAAYWFFHSAPPRHGYQSQVVPLAASFRLNAEKYRKILARNGVKLKILPSQGSQENSKETGQPILSR